MVNRRSKRGKNIADPDEYGGKVESTKWMAAWKSRYATLARPNVYLGC